MNLKLAICKKEGTTNYGSNGASAEVSIDLDPDFSIEMVSQVSALWHQALTAAVDSQLARMRTAPPAPQQQPESGYIPRRQRDGQQQQPARPERSIDPNRLRNDGLVGAIIRSGFVVDASWPIQTEMANRTRALASAALSSSVWLVCKKRPETARPGWDSRVLEEMRQNIHTRLRDYWDAGIRGPDFVWAATGPAMEAYSKHPVVKKANEPGKLMEVSEFLRAVRRLVVDFVVGRVLTGGDETSASGLDDVTTYYYPGTEEAHTNPTRQRGECLRALAGASG